MSSSPDSAPADGARQKTPGSALEAVLALFGATVVIVSVAVAPTVLVNLDAESQTSTVAPQKSLSAPPFADAADAG